MKSNALYTESADPVSLLLASYANSGFCHDRESASEVCCTIGEHLNGNRYLPLSRQSGQAQQHDPRVRLTAAENQFAKVFVLGDQDDGLMVCPFENVEIRRAGGQFCNMVNFISRAAKSAYDLSLDALVRKVLHSSAYRIYHIKAEDVGGVLDRRQYTLTSQRWIGVDYLFYRLARRELLKNQLDCDTGPFDHGFAEHHIWIRYDPRNTHRSLRFME